MLHPAYKHIVLVHYRDITEGKPNSGFISELPPGCSYTLSQSGNTLSIKNQGTAASLSDLHDGPNQNFSSMSIQVSSQVAAKRQRADSYNNLYEARNVSPLPIVEVSHVFQRLKEQLSQGDDSNEYSLFDNEKQDIVDTALLGYNEDVRKWDEFASLQQLLQYYDGDDGVGFGSANVASSLEGASLFDLLAYSYKIVARDTNSPEYYSMASGPDQFQMALEADSYLTIAQEQKFKIREVSPEWGFANETTKVIIIGSFLCDPSEDAWACMFGDIEVPVQIVQDGVLTCEAPLKCRGKVSICITSGNHEACSEVKEFEYRDGHTFSNCFSPQEEETKSTEELSLLLKYAQMLLSDSSVQEGEENDSEIVSRIQKVDEDSWDNIIDVPQMGSGTSYGTADSVLQELVKRKLQRWLSARFQKGDGNLVCTLSKKEQGIIHIVARLGYDWALNPILKSGVGVNFRDTNGWTALQWAARFGREKMVKALIAAGAEVTDPIAQNPAHKMPRTIAAESGHKALTVLKLSMGDAVCFEMFSSQTRLRILQVTFISKHPAPARNATLAAAPIEAAMSASGGHQCGFTSDEAQGLSATLKLAFDDCNAVALSIEEKLYRCWALTPRQKVLQTQMGELPYYLEKQMSRSDITARLAEPSCYTHPVLNLNQSPFVIADLDGNKYAFCLKFRNEGYLESKIRFHWLKFVDQKMLQKRDMVVFFKYKSDDPRNLIVIAIKRSLGDGRYGRLEY